MTPPDARPVPGDVYDSALKVVGWMRRNNCTRLLGLGQVAHIEKQAADWEAAYRAGQETYRALAAILGADMPRELLVDVAHRRTARIAELEMFARQWAVADAALVKADSRIAELEAAIDKLAQCKGRYHTEENLKALIEVRNKSLHK